MHLGGDWEFFYASALVDFATAGGPDRRAAAEALLSAFDAHGAMFNDAELKLAQRRASDGIATTFQWERMTEARKRRWTRLLEGRLPSEVGATVGFTLMKKGRFAPGVKGMTFEPGPMNNRGLRMIVTHAAGLSLVDAVALGLALFVGDRNSWRLRLAKCPLPGCGRVFLRGGFGRGKPRGTCCEAHRRGLHLLQMKLKSGRWTLKERRNLRTPERTAKRKRQLDAQEAALKAARVPK